MHALRDYACPLPIEKVDLEKDQALCLQSFKDWYGHELLAHSNKWPSEQIQIKHDKGTVRTKPIGFCAVPWHGDFHMVLNSIRDAYLFFGTMKNIEEMAIHSQARCTCEKYSY